MRNVKRSNERGKSTSEWLVSRHSLSFGDYKAPQYDRFRTMRVLNDDVFDGGTGFEAHGHDNVEIVTYVVRGRLAHADNSGKSGELLAGGVQRISAGTGIVHEEFNSSADEPVRIIQMWFSPTERGLEPDYEHEHFSTETRRGGLTRLVDPEGRDGAVRINSDVSIFGSIIDQGGSLDIDVDASRYAWLQMVRGEAHLGDTRLERGDGVPVEGSLETQLEADRETEFLLIDLP